MIPAYRLLEALPAAMREHPLWHLCGFALFALLVVISRRAQGSGKLLVALWNLTGVLLHELSHLTVGILLRAKPTGFSLIPRRVGNHWQLGSVSFSHINAFNAVPIAVAPLLLLGIAYLAAMNWSFWFAPSFASTLGLYGTIFVLSYNALPSRQDLRVACNWRSLLLYAPIAALGLYILLR
jgi:hypothetical protein